MQSSNEAQPIKIQTMTRSEYAESKHIPTYVPFKQINPSYKSEPTNPSRLPLERASRDLTPERKPIETNALRSDSETLKYTHARKGETMKRAGIDTKEPSNSNGSIEALLEENKRLKEALAAAESQAKSNAILFSTEIERQNRQLSEKQKELDDIKKIIEDVAQKQGINRSYRTASSYIQRTDPKSAGYVPASGSKGSADQSVLQKLQEILGNFSQEKEQNQREINELRKKLNYSNQGDKDPSPKVNDNEAIDRKIPYYSPIRSSQKEPSTTNNTASPQQSFLDKGSGVGNANLKDTVVTQDSTKSVLDKNPEKQISAKYPLSQQQKTPLTQYNYASQSTTPKESTQYPGRFQFSRSELTPNNQIDNSALQRYPGSLVYSPPPQKETYTYGSYSDRNNRFKTPDNVLNREKPKMSYSPNSQRPEVSTITGTNSPQNPSQTSVVQTPSAIEGDLKKLQAELARMTGLLQQKDREIEKLKADNADASKSLLKANDSIDNLRDQGAKNANLLKQIESLQKEIVGLTVSERNLKAEIERLKSKNKFDDTNKYADDAASVGNKLRTQNEELENTRYYLTKENERMKNLIEQRDKQIERLLTENKARSDELQNLHKKTLEDGKKHQTELSALRQRMDATKDGDLLHLMTKLRGEHQSEIKRLKDEVQYNLIKSIEKEGKIRQMSDLVDRLTQDLQDRERQLDELTEKFSNIEQMRDSFGNKMEREVEKWRKKYEQLEQSSQQKIDEMVQSFEEFRNKDKDATKKLQGKTQEEAKIRHGMLMTEIERLVAENTKLKETLEVARENELGLGTQHEAEINELHDKIEGILNEKKESELTAEDIQLGDRQVLEGQINSLKARQGELEQAISDLRATNSKFSDEVNKAKREKQALAEKCKSLEEEKAILENKVSMLKSEKDKINKERQDMINEMGSLEEVINKNHSEQEKKIATLTKDNNELRDEISSLEDTLNLQQRETAKALSDQAKGFEREKQKFNNKMNELNIQIQLLTTERDQKQAKLNELKQRLEDVKQQKETELQDLRQQVGGDYSRRTAELEKAFKNEKTELEAKIKELTAKVKEAESRYENLQAELLELKDQNEQQGREIDQLREDLDKAEDERDTALDQLQSQFDLFTRGSIGVNDLEIRYKAEKSALEMQVLELQGKLALSEEARLSLEKEMKRQREQVADSGDLISKQKDMQEKIEDLDRLKKKYDEAIANINMTPMVSMLKIRESVRPSAAGGRLNATRKKSPERESEIIKE